MGLARLGASPPVPFVNPPDTEAADTEAAETEAAETEAAETEAAETEAAETKAAETEADLQRRQTTAPLDTTVPVEQGARLGKRAPGG